MEIHSPLSFSRGFSRLADKASSARVALTFLSAKPIEPFETVGGLSTNGKGTASALP